jgi:hypothetical protein
LHAILLGGSESYTRQEMKSFLHNRPSNVAARMPTQRETRSLFEHPHFQRNTRFISHRIDLIKALKSTSDSNILYSNSSAWRGWGVDGMTRSNWLGHESRTPVTDRLLAFGSSLQYEAGYSVWQGLDADKVSAAQERSARQCRI